MSKFANSPKRLCKSEWRPQKAHRPQATSKEKVSDTKDYEQAVKSLGGSYHEVFEAHIPFLRAKQYLDFSTMRIVIKNCFIIHGKIRAQEDAESLWVAKSFFGVRKQHDSF